MLRVTAIFVLAFFCFVLIANGAAPIVPCHFIFGDSLSDAGNNNELRTMAKANYPPYGVDFPNGPGRFTNGRTIVDFITQFLGFPNLIKPYSNHTDQDILSGINFASEAGGILMETGSNLGDRMWMDRQLQNYMMIISRLQSKVQGPVANYLNKCLYTVNIGSDDYINNYFMPQLFPSKRLFTPDQFANLLIDRYRAQLQVLYNSGARKFAIFGLGQIGCTPAEKARFNASTLQCVQEINVAVQLFNKNLVTLVDSFNANLVGAKFTFIDFFAIQTLNPLPPGVITNSTCCQVRTSDFQCMPFSQPCAIRTLYSFYDGLHPTEILNELIATISYSTPVPVFVHPMSISQLAISQLRALY